VILEMKRVSEEVEVRVVVVFTWNWRRGEGLVMEPMNETL
jgi:hypothetical protein